jgi:hypothetical protein
MNNNNNNINDPAVKESMELDITEDYGGAHMDPTVKKPLGIIQSRGLGDLFIAIPIARHYYESGHTIYWPVCEEFYPTVSACAPWIHWIKLKTDQQGLFFYDSAMLALKYIVEEDSIINLYQFLSSRPQDSDPDIFPILKFDQYKYAVAGVPFLDKWTLGAYLVRDEEEEQRVFDTMVKKRRYIVTHLQGSDASVQLDFSAVDPAVQVINITEGITSNATAWLKVLENAEALYLIDSCYSNLVDQLDIPVDKTFIRRSKMDLTPVLGSAWSYMSPP